MASQRRLAKGENRRRRCLAAVKTAAAAGGRRNGHRLKRMPAKSIHGLAIGVNIHAIVLSALNLLAAKIQCQSRRRLSANAINRRDREAAAGHALTWLSSSGWPSKTAKAAAVLSAERNLRLSRRNGEKTGWHGGWLKIRNGRSAIQRNSLATKLHQAAAWRRRASGKAWLKA
jgi:hypothetical protein